jgi:hypothetical protein
MHLSSQQWWETLNRIFWAKSETPPPASLQNNYSERARSVAQVVEVLFNKCEALSSNPSTATTTKTKHAHTYIPGLD